MKAETKIERTTVEIATLHINGHEVIEGKWWHLKNGGRALIRKIEDSVTMPVCILVGYHDDGSERLYWPRSDEMADLFDDNEYDWRLSHPVDDDHPMGYISFAKANSATINAYGDDIRDKIEYLQPE